MQNVQAKHYRALSTNFSFSKGKTWVLNGPKNSNFLCTSCIVKKGWQLLETFHFTGNRGIKKWQFNIPRGPRGITPIYSLSLERKKVQAFCLLQIFLSDIRTTKIQNCLFGLPLKTSLKTSVCMHSWPKLNFGCYLTFEILF